MHKLYTATDGEVTLTIIADSMGEASDIAVDAMDVPVDEMEMSLATPEHPRRWVQFYSRSDADSQVREIESHGVDLARVHLRHVTDGHGMALYSEVGAYDDHWCRLPSGVLCGGGE